MDTLFQTQSFLGNLGVQMSDDAVQWRPGGVAGLHSSGKETLAALRICIRSSNHGGTRYAYAVDSSTYCADEWQLHLI